MSRQRKTLIFSVASLVVALCATTAILSAGAPHESSVSSKPISPQSRTEPRTRNLSLQPEAFRLSRRLGARFTPKARGTTTTTATLKVGTSQQVATIIRRQTDNGESVDVVLGDRTLTWSDSDGVRVGSSSPNATERALVEQLIFASPDQFILAQLRGASYQVVARNVRADVGGSDSYSGPLWDLIRVEEPGTEATRESRPWRLYYINVQTGLIDKIVSEFAGVRIEANLLNWVDQAGEKVPSHIVWKRNEETVQEFQVTSLDIQR